MTEYVEQEKQHSQLGASTAERIMLCPGSVKLIRELKKKGLIPSHSKPSIYAAEGTAAHLIASILLADKLAGGEPTVKEGDTVRVDDYTFTVNDEMMESVMVYVYHCLNIVETYPEVDYWIEQEVCLRHLSPTQDLEDEMWGTPDFVGYVPGVKLEVVDYKHGKGHLVDPVNNIQLMYYALAAMEKLFAKQDRLEFLKHRPPEIWLTIAQPRHFAGGVQTSVIDFDTLKEFREKLMNTMKEAVTSDSPPLVPGEIQCQWCPARRDCPALRGSLEEATQQDFALMTLDSELPAPATISMEQKLKLYFLRGLFNTWFDANEEDIKRAAMMGVETPGVKLVRTEPNYKPVEGFEVVLSDTLSGDEVEKFFKPQKPISKTDAAKLLKKYNLNLDISELYYRPEGNIVLAPETDRRPRIEPLQIEDSEHGN